MFNVCSLIFSFDKISEEAPLSEVKSRDSLKRTSLDESSQVGEGIWQYREDVGPPVAKPVDSQAPGSPRAHKAPPPVRPKPSRPTPPNKHNSGSDLMATIQAAQAARIHRPPLGSSSSVDMASESGKRERPGSVEDDTFL